MKYLIILFIFLSVTLKSQICKAFFTYGASFERVEFFNSSQSNNAHFYWNFGDGSSSNLRDPIHEFGGNGNYLVTLYVNDTVSNCSDYYEQWIYIVYNSGNTCFPIMMDSVYQVNGNSFVKLIDYSNYCNNYSRSFHVGWYSGNNGTFGLTKYPANYIGGVYYGPSNIVVAAFKTIPNNYNRSKNYQDCSANFEFSVVSEDTLGQRILFKAMNKNAAEYKWAFFGFGSPIWVYTDTASLYFPDNINSVIPNLSWDALLITKGKTGCRDSLIQPFVIRKKSFTYVGMKEQKDISAEVQIIPNPVKDRFKLKFEKGTAQLHKITFTNTLGQQVYILNEPKPEEEINISFLASGVYYLVAENAKGQNVFKVLKE